MSLVRLALVCALLSLPPALAGCGDSPRAAPAAPPVEAAPVKKGVPNLTKAQDAKLTTDFSKARDLVAEARKFRREGRKILAKDGAEAANDKFLKARRLYRQAAQITEDWVEPELGVVTKAQIDIYLGSLVRERGKWMKESGKMGKLHD